MSTKENTTVAVEKPGEDNEKAGGDAKSEVKSKKRFIEEVEVDNKKLKKGEENGEDEVDEDELEEFAEEELNEDDFDEDGEPEEDEDDDEPEEGVEDDEEDDQ